MTIKNKRITDSEITETLSKVSQKPTAFSGQNFPFTDLNDRTFEILLYQIFKLRIETNDFTLNEKFDDVFLMQGIGERGRDCFLTKKGKNVGLIQCKQVKNNLTKPDIIREILKFVLHYLVDKSLISDINNFNYFFAVSKGFAETSINLFADFNKKIKSEDLKKYCEELKLKYKSLSLIDYEINKNEINKVLSKINVKPIIPSDLNKFLIEHDTIIKNFFKVLTVTDNTLLESIIDIYLSPILNKIIPNKDRNYIDFSYRFKEYLQRVYNNYSSARTLVFGNQQKKLEDFYYPLNLECNIDEDNSKILNICTLKYEDDFLPEFKKVLIVDNGGMGKSTIMKWLFLSVIKYRKGIPIFIELRKLKNKKTIIDEIISELNPIDKIIEKDVVTELIARGNFIFFFDGFDEISDDDREFVTNDLQNFISKSFKNLFIMTSRPEVALNTFSDFKEFRVKKLLKEEAFELIKKIGNNGEKSLRLIKKLSENNSHNIDDFLTSPLLVSLLYKKFEHRENIPLQLQEFYYDVFEALFQDHDLTKGESFTRNKKTKLSFNDFFQVLRELAFYTFKKGEIEYNDAVLSKYIQTISKRLPNIKFKPIDFIDDLVKSVPLFNKEGLQYRWSHKSFQEYFASEFICRDSKDKQVEILSNMYYSEKSERYSFVFSLCYDIDFKPFRKAIIIPYIKEFIFFYDNSFKSLSENLLFDKIELGLRKSITFNNSYLIITEKNKNYKNNFLANLKLDDMFNGQKIEGHPEFIKDGYKLKTISFSEYIVLKSTKKSDLIELLTNKKSELTKPYKNQRNHKMDNNNNNNNNIELPEFVVIDDFINFSNDTNKNLIFFNELILNNTLKGENYLDIEICRKYLKKFYDDNLNESNDNYSQGF